MINKKPIGIFDSGVGGTSILKELIKLLPYEDFVYLSDSDNAPYGVKPKEEIIKLSQKNTEFLINQFDVKLIVVACNTATTNAIDYLRQIYTLPFIGIEPAIKPAALNSKTKYIGVLATKGTLSSELFEKTSGRLKNKVKLLEVEGKHIVEAVESGKTQTKEFKHQLQQQVEIFKTSNIDYLVLGCTHYPYIKTLLEEFLPKIKIIDSGFAVAKQTKTILEQNHIKNNSKTSASIKIYTNKANEAVIQKLFEDQNLNLKISFLDF